MHKEPAALGTFSENHVRILFDHYQRLQTEVTNYMLWQQQAFPLFQADLQQRDRLKAYNRNAVTVMSDLLTSFADSFKNNFQLGPLQTEFSERQCKIFSPFLWLHDAVSSFELFSEFVLNMLESEPDSFEGVKMMHERFRMRIEHDLDEFFAHLIIETKRSDLVHPLGDSQNAASDLPQQPPSLGHETEEDLSITSRSVEADGSECTLWLVERRKFGEFICQNFLRNCPSVRLRWFTDAEGALSALAKADAPPDILMTAFYFNGDYHSGLWLVQEARKIYPNIITVVTTGFALKHLQGITDDWPVQPNLMLGKGDCQPKIWITRLKELLTHQGGAQLSHSMAPPKESELNEAMQWQLKVNAVEAPRTRASTERPLVFFVCPPDCLNTLKRCMGREIHPPRFACGYDWEHFETPEAAIMKLDELTEEPEALVTGYYFSGGYFNRLKLIKHFQQAFPGIYTVLVGAHSEEHMRGIIEGTGISPNLFLHRSEYLLDRLGFYNELPPGIRRAVQYMPQTAL